MESDVITLTDDEFEQNTYLIKFKNQNILIDAGISIEKIKSVIDINKINKIILTHGHYDHIRTAIFFDKSKIYAHFNEKIVLESPAYNLSSFFKNHIIISGINYLKGNLIKMDNDIEVFHTPGHTSGSIIVKIDNNLFTGDTLFYDSIGRTDLPTGNEKKLNESLEIFLNFDKDTIIYPGHGRNAKLKEVFKRNEYLHTYYQK